MHTFLTPFCYKQTHLGGKITKKISIMQIFATFLFIFLNFVSQSQQKRPPKQPFLSFL